MLRDPKVLLVFLGFGSLMLFSGWMFSGEAEGQAVQLPEGQQPYVPTRVEWMAMELNAQSITLATSDGGHVETVYHTDGGNGIQAIVAYNADTSSAYIRDAQQRAMQNLRDTAQFYGWEGWIEHSIERVEVDW